MLLKHACVIGGGMAGLLHARVLADYAEQVTIIDRDQMPEQPEPRPGVPQGTHIHYLMVRGLQLLDEWFPGLRDEIERDSGAPRVQIGLQTRYMLYQTWQPSVDTGMHTYVLERPHLEDMVRRHLLTRENVKLLDRTEAVDLVFGGDNVSGVVTRKRPSGGEAVTLPADLVIDASGRGSKTMSWLEKAGYALPQTHTIDAKLGYATRWYAKPESANTDWRILYVLTSPPAQTRGGAILEHRGARWLSTVVGTNGDYPPTDEAGFLEFARSLPDPVIYESLKDAQPLTDIVSFRNTSNRWHAFEKLDRLPGRLYITGDAVCEVNPVYGQGMTKAALNASVLQQQLAAGLLDNRVFFRAIAKVNDNFWQAAAGGDLNYPGTTNNQPETPIERVMRAYLSAVLRGSVRDQRVTYAFNRVLNMVDPSTTLMMPGMLLRVLRAQGTR
ncbi:MAG: FAD-dependent monooxygenase [Anaerolineae bacterium]|nr:FAD-dependent monooxygenase [Anaerolineae bacterium]